MKVEVRCPGCSTSYVVDDTDAELLCPGCGTSIAIGASSDLDDAVSSMFDRQAPADRPGTAAPAAAATPLVAAAASVATSAPPTAGAADAVSEEVVCPRCKLHFVPRRASGAPEAEDRRTVLIVEDMNYFRQVAADALADEYDVKTAATVDEALAALHDSNVDLLVLDLTLDGGEFGLDLLRGLPAKPCPILIYTAKDESEIYGDEWEELRRLGADDIVIKGMNVGDSLPRKVGALLGKPWDDDD